MSKPKRTTKTVSASDVRQHWSALVNEVFQTENRVRIERSGIPVAGLVSASDLARLEAWDSIDAILMLEQLQANASDINEEQLLSEVAEVIAEVRQEQRSATQVSRTG